MKDKILLTIAIPTYNRAACLEKLLDNILSQAEGLEEKVEICISNNSSPDNTHEIVMNFKKKYPDVNYNKNEKNLGVERNILKAIEMSHGEFIWVFGDDDLIVQGGLKDIVGFIEENSKENTALITLKEKAYFIDQMSGEKIIYYDSVEPKKPLVFEINRENIIDGNFPGSAFMTALIFKSSFLKNLSEQEKGLIEKAIGNEYLPMFLLQLMFLKFSDIEGITLNKYIICQELFHQKFYIEKRFNWHYVFKKRLNELLLSTSYIDSNTVKRFKKSNKRFRRDIIQEIILMKTFKTFFYHSYFGILKEFFSKAEIKDGLMISFVFLVSSLTPSFILQSVIKVYFLLKYGKEWKSHWIFCYAAHCEVARPV